MSELLALSLSIISIATSQGNRGNSLYLTDTDKILLNLSTLERSINERNGEWFTAHFSPSYNDTNKTNFTQLKHIIQNFIANVSPNGKVPLFIIDNPKVIVYRNFAGVTLKILVNGWQIQKREPLFMKSEDRIIFRKEGGWWKIVSTKKLLKLLKKEV